MPKITTKRSYDPPVPQNGLHVPVDRLWPRGLPKAAARVNLRLKHTASGAELRRRVDREPRRWRDFCTCYGAGHDNAAALKAFLERKPPA